MKMGDRIPELKFKMKNHSEERLKAMKFHRTLEAPELFYYKFPVVKSNSGKILLAGKIIVSSENGNVNCYLYGQNNELYQAFFVHNPNTDSHIFKINKKYVDELAKLGIKEKTDEKKK